MTQAFYTGIGGIQAHQNAIDVLTDNLANTSTTGFRGYSAEFSSMFENMINTPAASSSVDSSIGVGVNLNAVVMDEKQGVLELTNRSTDLAILGDGWFGIQGEGKPLYTRDGSFVFDKNRDLVTNDGYYVLGTMSNNIDGEVLTEQLSEAPLGDVAAQEKLRFPENLLYSAEPTTTAKFYVNLGTEDLIRSVSAEVVDSDSKKNSLRLEFQKSVPQTLPGSQWDVTATTQSLDGTEIYSTENGIVNIGAEGALVSTTLTSIDNKGVNINIDLGSGYSGVAVTGSTFSSSSEANGLEAGELLGYDINKNGEVVATFSNGRQSAVGAIAVYHFQNDRGLERVNGARFKEGINSGQPLFSKDENGKNIIGTDITNFKLEGSNVRMEVGLTEIIVLQRAFDANSKSITTSDQMLQKALNMDG